MKKIDLGIIFGGRSVEHEVSVKSAENIIRAVDIEKYSLSVFGIDKNGIWYLYDIEDLLKNSDLKRIELEKLSKTEVIFTGRNKDQFISVDSKNKIADIDVFFPVIHGIYGEDGTIQGILKHSCIPFVGSDIIGSSIGMDKDVMKRILRDAHIPIADFMVFHSYEKQKIDFDDICAQLGLPFFVKPANSGSSVGISKVSSKNDLQRSVDEAFKYDSKIIVEKYIKGRELECSLLGNENISVSVVGEIIPESEFYSYRSKYLDENGAQLIIPADISPELYNKIKEYAVKAYKCLCCEGMARIDLFLAENNIFLNEINTIPGFTKNSMYPLLWEASGISFTVLIDSLVELAFEKHSMRKKIITSYEEIK